MDIGMIFWGIALIVVGLLMGLFGVGLGGVVQWIGWLLLAVGVVLAVIYAIGRAGHRTNP